MRCAARRSPCRLIPDAKRVVSVRFLGNEVLSDEALAQAMFNSWTALVRGFRGSVLPPEALGDDVTGLKQAYYAKGYISAQVEHSAGSQHPTSVACASRSGSRKASPTP